MRSPALGLRKYLISQIQYIDAIGASKTLPKHNVSYSHVGYATKIESVPVPVHYKKSLIIEFIVSSERDIHKLLLYYGQRGINTWSKLNVSLYGPTQIIEFRS